MDKPWDDRHVPNHTVFVIYTFAYVCVIRQKTLYINPYTFFIQPKYGKPAARAKTDGPPSIKEMG